MRYDTMEEFNVTRKLSIELNLALVARKKETKTNASAPLIQYRLRSVKVSGFIFRIMCYTSNVLNAQ